MKLGAAIILLAGLSGCDSSSEVGSKSIVVIDVSKIFRDSAPADQARQHLLNVRESLAGGARKLEGVYGEKSDHPSQAMLKQGLVRLNAQYHAEKLNANRKVEEALGITAKKWLQEHPGRVVIPSARVLVYPKNADITNEILARMKDIKPDFGTVPVVGINSAPPDPFVIKKNDDSLRYK